MSNWPQVPLREVGVWYGGATPAKSNPEFWTDGTVPWLTPKDMGANVLVGTQDRITEEALRGSSVRLVPPDSVAVVVRSGILTRTLPVSLVPFATTLNQDMKAVAVRGDSDPRWIAWGLRAFEHQLMRETRKAGTTVASVEWPRFLNFRLPLPPHNEQLRVIDVLEEHLSRLDAASIALTAVGHRISAWRAAVLDQEIWSLECPRTQVTALLRQPMRNGRSDRACKSGESGTRTLTLTAVTRNEFTDRFTKVTITPPHRAEGLWLEPGDILVQRSNTPELVGTAARFDGASRWAIFPDLMVRLRPDETVIDSRFMVAALRSQRAHRTLRSKAKGLAGSMPKVDQGAIGSVVVPVPPMADQRRIIDRIDRGESAAGLARREAEAQQLKANVLRRALLSAAFSGRLTGRSSDLDLVAELANA